MTNKEKDPDDDYPKRMKLVVRYSYFVILSSFVILQSDLFGGYFFIRAYSRLSTSACKLASMILSCTPTVPHSSLPSVDSIKTRVRASVPAVESRMRTL